MQASGVLVLFHFFVFWYANGPFSMRQVTAGHETESKAGFWVTMCHSY